MIHWVRQLAKVAVACDDRGRMRRHGKTFGVSDPRTVTKEEAAPHVSGASRRLFAGLPFEQAVLLTKTG